VSWPNVAIKEVALVVTGKTPSKKVSEYFGGDIPFVTPSELNQIYVETAPVTLTEAGAQTIKLVPSNSVMVCCIGSLGKVAIASRELATNQQINSVIFDETRVFPKYGYYALQLLKPMMDRVAPSTTVAIINKSRFEGFEIPLPPLKEQERIAAILDKADAVRRKRQQAIELADQFLRSVFLDMFGDPVTNPKGWETRKVSQLGEVVTGSTPSRKEKEFYGDYIEWIKSDNINTPSHFLTIAEEFLSEKGSKVGRVVSKGSLLVTCIAGSKDCIGNSAIADRDVAFNQQINALTPYDKEDLFFLYAQIAQHKKLIQKASTEGMKGLVSKSKFSEILLIYPDKKLRSRFVSIFERALASSAKRIDAHDKADSMFSSLSQQAFKGELTQSKAA
jgi:type I restriction enzyme, S subunit